MKITMLLLLLLAALSLASFAGALVGQSGYFDAYILKQ